MRVDAFDFVLPPERIALAPANPRDSARMLVVGADGALTDAHVRDLPDFLHAGDALVVNDTRVIAARLEGVRVRGEAVAPIEATLIERVDDCRWRALARPAKRLEVGERIRFGETSESMACLLGALDAEVEDKGEARRGSAALRVRGRGARRGDRAARRSRPCRPISPRGARSSPSDRADYQTMFAAKPGAVAAPTAGLHFTPALVARLAARGVALHRVTLHVGAGTFLPVKVEDTRDHKMHSEWGSIDAATAEALNAVREAGRPDRLRRHDLRAPSRKRRRRERAASAVLGRHRYLHHSRLSRFAASTRSLTNFHLPRSTLFMLVSRLQRARDHARGLRARHSSRLPLLFLRRRLPVEPRGAPATAGDERP